MVRSEGERSKMSFHLWTMLILPGVISSNWNVHLPEQSIYTSRGSTVVIPCSFTYPEFSEGGLTYRVSSVMWCRNQERCITLRYVYHSDGIFPEPAFQGRVEYLGDMKGNCTLKITDLRTSDSGTYVFRFITDHPMEKLPGQSGVILNVSDSRISMAAVLVISVSVLAALLGALFWCMKRKWRGAQKEHDRTANTQGHAAPDLLQEA
uniref:Ig-like domain-containing protein n=1 Tax=Scleropages formosus TaxID=113540 RepID=A0A8C9SD96_SCLFO